MSYRYCLCQSFVFHKDITHAVHIGLAVNQGRGMANAGQGGLIEDYGHRARTPGYGGRRRVGCCRSCFPKDIRALKHLAHSAGLEPSLLGAVAAVNNRQRLLPLKMLHARFGDDLKGLQVGVLGLAFKPGTWELAGGR